MTKLERPAREDIPAAYHYLFTDDYLGGRDFSGFDDEAFVLLQYADAVATRDVTDRIHDALAQAYTPGEIVANGLIVDFYVGLCTDVASVELPFEGGTFVGWTPADETIEAPFA